MKDAQFLEQEPIEGLYRWFADEANPTSPVWERLCRWIAETPEINARLDVLPGQARQPNRFLAALRHLDGPLEPGPDFVAWVDREWPRVEQIVLTRTTQTNEPGRCTVLAPLLASLPQPVALLEIGASAGLCLLPDRYAYAMRYAEGSPHADPSPAAVVRPGAASPDAPVLPCRVTGTPPGDPASLVVAARLGIDRDPLDVADPDTRRWLRALVWPGEEDREERLAQAQRVAAADPPEVRRADLTDGPAVLLGGLVDQLRAAHPHATPVVVHSAVLAYLAEEAKQAVCTAIRGSGARWISMEGQRVVPEVTRRLPEIGEPPAPSAFALAVDGRPVGWAQPHGRSVVWGRA